MPTCGWIMEDASDKLAETFGLQAVERPRPYKCPHCTLEVETFELLSRHVEQKHPMEVPSLLIHGCVAQRQMIIRKRLHSIDVEVLNCTSAEVYANGTPGQISPTQLCDRLSRATQENFRIVLKNETQAVPRKAVTAYAIEFRVPVEDHLDRCDEEFIARLELTSLRMRDVVSFPKNVPKDPPTLDYAGALADYVVGVLLKDQGGDTIGSFEEYKSKFMQAREVLVHFNRKVAASVVAAIDFNLNAWDSFSPPGSLKLFARAKGFFSGLVAGSPITDRAPDELAGEFSICPVDQVTFDILLAIRNLGEPSNLRATMACVEALVSHTSGMVSEYDLVKARVIGGVAGVRSGERAAAVRCLSPLRTDYTFGEWARSQLEEIG